MFWRGNDLALAGYEKIAEPLIEIGANMRLVGSLPHRRLNLDPLILNEDGSFNTHAWRAKLARMVGDPVAQDQVYYWSKEWQADEREADQDIKNGRTMDFSTPEAAVAYLEGISRTYYPTNI